MGDLFEKFIRENREHFDESTPSDQIWSKIEQRLGRKTSHLSIAWKIAAVLFLASTIFLLIDRKETDISGPQLSEEFVQAEDYYVTMINERKQAIKEQLTPDQEKEFLREINQLDSMYEELKNTYQINATNDRVVDAMINNLQLRLDILNKQLRILENIKREKNETDATIEI